MEQENKTTNIVKPFLAIFVIVFISTLFVYKFFGFEIGLLYCISISIAFASMAFAGLENIIINKEDVEMRIENKINAMSLEEKNIILDSGDYKEFLNQNPSRLANYLFEKTHTDKLLKDYMIANHNRFI